MPYLLFGSSGPIKRSWDGFLLKTQSRSNCEKEARKQLDNGRISWFQIVDVQHLKVIYTHEDYTREKELAKSFNDKLVDSASKQPSTTYLKLREYVLREYRRPNETAEECLDRICSILYKN